MRGAVASGAFSVFRGSEDEICFAGDFVTAAEIAKRLNGRRSGTGWVARCPAHHDNDPSLSLRDEGGKVLVHCHAGCDQAAVIRALSGRGLWPECPLRGERVVVATYDYCDEDGHLLYQVVRTVPKGFYQRRPDGFGGWINKKGERQVLYRLSEVLEAPIVFVVEGEKDAETLRDQGFAATTNAGGAKAPWLPQYTESLRGREVILLPDNDPPGRQRVLTIARALLGHAARIIVLELGNGKDVSEWFERDHSELELLALVERPKGTR
jgi:putative DNA primase/helicase